MTLAIDLTHMSPPRWLVVVPLAAAGLASFLWVSRQLEERTTARIWDSLRQPGGEVRFDPASIADLPEIARRHLLYAIEPGTPLARSAELRMSGQILLAPDADPLALRAHQILTPPVGFVWRAVAEGGGMKIRGFDRYAAREGAMRWWLYGFMPVMRASGEDVTRSAAGRLGAESVLVPATLLPAYGARWEAVDDSTARVHLTVDEAPCTLTLTIAPDGALRQVSLMRWQDAERQFQRFDVRLGESLAVQGYMIPSRIEAGWRLGGPEEFRFFEAVLDEVTFQ
jgi:hypothetical protein